MIPAPQHILSLRPYVAGRSVADIEREYGVTAIKLASNENPLGASPLALEAARATLDGSLAVYPDGGRELREAIADRFVIRPENVICGAGSESIIAAALRAFLEPESEMITSEGTFIGFQVLARASSVRTHYVPLRNYGYDLNGIAARINERTRIIYISNPNNPTGSAVSTAELEHFMTRVPENVLVILDEAYFEYAADWPDYPDSMHYRWDNVLTCRTFSKAYGLAGLRIGYGMAHSEIITLLHKVKLPFEPATPAAAAGLAALGDTEFLHSTVELNRESLLYFHKEFERLGLQAVPSLANYVMIDFGTGERVENVFDGLIRHGVITRPLEAFGLRHCLRISTGTMEQNQKCVAALEEVMGELVKVR